jgi:hypothetical protein
MFELRTSLTLSEILFKGDFIYESLLFMSFTDSIEHSSASFNEFKSLMVI